MRNAAPDLRRHEAADGGTLAVVDISEFWWLAGFVESLQLGCGVWLNLVDLGVLVARGNCWEPPIKLWS